MRSQSIEKALKGAAFLHSVRSMPGEAKTSLEVVVECDFDAELCGEPSTNKTELEEVSKLALSLT